MGGAYATRIAHSAKAKHCEKHPHMPPIKSNTKKATKSTSGASKKASNPAEYSSYFHRSKNEWYAKRKLDGAIVRYYPPD